MKFKNRIAITRRGYQMLGKYCPGLIRGKVIIAVLEALDPLVTVWFSARIINEIEGNRHPDPAGAAGSGHQLCLLHDPERDEPGCQREGIENVELLFKDLFR